MSQLVAAIGYTSEKTFGYFVNAMHEQGLDLQVVDLSRLRDCSHAAYQASHGKLRIEIDNMSLDLADFGAVYQRCYYSDLGRSDISAWTSELVCEINAYLSIAPARVVNRPHVSEYNGSKFAHLETLRKCGFSVPESHVLSDGDAARRLLRPDQNWISKGCSGQRTEVAVLDVPAYMRLDTLAHAPVLFQGRVRGPNVRTHRVGDRSVSLKIESDGIDYRYAETAAFEPIETPSPIQVAMAQYQKASGLEFIGFDFRIDERGGEWICLEANPMPGYDFYDRHCDGAVSQLLKDLLTRPLQSSLHSDEQIDTGIADCLFIDSSRRRAVNSP